MRNVWDGVRQRFLADVREIVAAEHVARREFPADLRADIKADFADECRAIVAGDR